MELISIPLGNDKWSEFISGHADADIFHSPSWLEFLVSCYGFIPQLLAVVDEKQQIRAGIPLMEVNSWLTRQRIIGLPYSDFCAPVIDGKINMADLVQLLQDWRKTNRWSDLKIHWPLPADQRGVYKGESFFHHITRLLESPDRTVSNFSKSQVQRSIKLAEKRGVTVKFSRAWEDVYAYYFLHLQTRRRQGVPVQPLRFFRLLWEQLISQGFGFVQLAYQQDQILAGAVFLNYSKTLTYKFGASNSSFWHLRPNHLIFWHAICWGCKNGYMLFDWGRTELDNLGLRDFKRGWASEEKILNYTVLADKSPSYKFGSSFQRNAMKRIIQRSPLWVCRLIGELFYVHAA